MHWSDQGILLRSRKHGEASAIVEVLTTARGRHAGVVRGAASRKMAPVLQPGTQVAVEWRARLEDHLGSYSIEPLQSRAAFLADRQALAALNAVTGLLCFALPEREPHRGLFDRTTALLDMIATTEAWPLAYLHWELALLQELGFGLDLSRCAVTGHTEGLAFVSPKSGRAVTAAAAGEWQSKLLPLPACLRKPQDSSVDELRDAFRTTGYFLHHRLAPTISDRGLPPSRDRLTAMLTR